MIKHDNHINTNIDADVAAPGRADGGLGPGLSLRAQTAAGLAAREAPEVVQGGVCVP